MKTFRIGFWMVLLSMAVSPLWAAQYEIDTAHSNVNFKVKHLGISTVPGRFNKFSGTFAFDEKNVDKSKADVLVDVTTIDTQNEKRDAHLKSPDFFDAAKYPTAHFVSKKVTSLKDGKFTVNGTLTMHGVTKPVVLDVDYSGSVKDPWGGQRAAFTATTTINRQDFGIKWNQILDNGGVMVSDEVKLEFGIEGVAKTKGKPVKK
jgi:polyisoprenoid-binding protein YceI